MAEPNETRARTSDRVCTSSSAPYDPYGQGRTHTGKSENDSQISCYSISLYFLPLWLFFLVYDPTQGLQCCYAKFFIFHFTFSYFLLCVVKVRDLI